MMNNNIKHNVPNHFIQIIQDCQHFSKEKALSTCMDNLLSSQLTFNHMKIQASNQVFELRNRLKIVFSQVYVSKSKLKIAFSQVFVQKSKLNKVLIWKVNRLPALISEI